MAVLTATLAWLATTSAARAVQLHNPTFSGAAVAVAGGGVRISGTLGETGPVGRAAGGGWVLLEGFWHPGAGYASAVDPEPQEPGADGASFRNALTGNHPNPFSGGTRFAFSVASPAPVTLDIYDLAGRRVRTLLAGALPAGHHDARWDGRDDRGAVLPSGLYHAHLRIGSWSATSRLMLVR